MSNRHPSRVSNPRVLVTYAWVRSSWAMIRNLARHGLKVYAGDTQQVFMSRYSRYCAGWLRHPDFKKDPEGFISALVEFITAHDIGTYLPSHEEGFIVAKYRDRFPAGVKIPISPHATIEAMDNKLLAQQLAQELSIPHPRTFQFSGEADFQQRKGDLPAHGVVKRTHSHGSHGVGIYQTPGELERHWSEAARGLASGDNWPIVQEFITARIYAVSLLADEGRVLASFVRRNLREKEPFGGACVKAESTHLPEAVAHATRIAEHLRFTGVAMFEFLVDEQNDRRCWLMEINPRYWGTSAHDIDCGVEFPWLQFCMANGIAFEPFPEYRDGLKSRWIAGDVISYLKRRQSAPGQRGSLRQYLDFDDDFYMDFKLDDPIPFLVQAYLYFKFRAAVLAPR
ncbi:MAG: putative ATP-grasp enzyme [Chthoniobacteraceae bacterium]|nr:putative ATP-grasp enzyme [Chthoniobacteraceae bacterium]